MVGTSLQLDGAPLSQFELASGLLDRGLTVEVLSPCDGPLRARYAASRIPVSVRPELVCSPAVPAWYEKDVQRLAALFSAERPDLVLASTVDAFSATDAAWLAGIPSIWNIRESEPWRARLADRHTKIAARALACFSYPDAVIFVAEASANVWRRFIPNGRAHVVYNAPHPDLLAAVRAGPGDVLSRHGVLSSEKLFVSIGTLCERKGQLDLAHALNKFPAARLAGIRVAFVGRSDKSYEAAIRAALSPAAAQRCIFVGPVANAVEWICAASALVNTSRSEAFPRSFIEAAAAGTPIIATDVDGASERLSDEHSALFYRPGDVDALASSLVLFIADPARGRALAAAAQADLISAWTFDDMTDAYAAHIARAIAGDRKPKPHV